MGSSCCRYPVAILYFKHSHTLLPRGEVPSCWCSSAWSWWNSIFRYPKSHTAPAHKSYGSFGSATVYLGNCLIICIFMSSGLLLLFSKKREVFSEKRNESLSISILFTWTAVNNETAVSLLMLTPCVAQPYSKAKFTLIVWRIDCSYFRIYSYKALSLSLSCANVSARYPGV